MNTKSTIFSSFNAKAMSFDDIASSFIPSQKFTELCGNHHSLLLGPRGSGKTTLLKMLSIDGIRSWNNLDGSKFQKEVDFTGIYIPADSVWGGMIDAISGEDVNLEKVQLRKLLMEAAFTTNVLMATAHTLYHVHEEAGFRSIPLSRDKFKKLFNDISALWKLESEAYSFMSMKQSLSKRLLELQQLSVLLSSPIGMTSIIESLKKFPYLGLDVFDAAARALDLVNDISNKKDYLWALLFDEFEIAPESLQTKIFTTIRGSSIQHVLYKIALAPCGPHTLIDNIENAPSAAHDFKPTQLWYINKKDSDTFCEQLFLSKINKYQTIFSEKNPKEILGDSQYPMVDENGNEEDITINMPKKNIWVNEFIQLANKDSTFRDYLDNKGMKLDELSKSVSDQFGNTIRKISPVVAFRNSYQSSTQGRKRGGKPYRKNYYGWSAISAISEGNPRWLIAMISGILDEAVQNNVSGVISHTVQTKHIAAISSRYVDILKTASVRPFPTLFTEQPIYSILKKIGNYFHDKIVLDKFVEDPNMSFVVDKNIDSDIEHCLRIALNHGAIVCYDDADELGYKTLKNRRFRLSYLLSPEFGLPIRKSSKCQLSKILNSTTKIKSSTHDDLFAEHEETNE